VTGANDCGPGSVEAHSARCRCLTLEHMNTTESSAVRWTFILHPDGLWTWRLAAGDGMPDQVSGTCGSAGAVMADAVRHGFNPERHLWTVAHQDWQASRSHT